MLNSYKKLFVVLAVLIAPLMFIAACDDSAPPRPMDDTPAPPDPDPPSEDARFQSAADTTEAIFPGIVASFIGLENAADSALEPIVANVPIGVATLRTLNRELVDELLDLDNTQLGTLFNNIQTVVDGSSAVADDVSMIQEAINEGINNLLVFGEVDAPVPFIGTAAPNNDAIVALVDSLEIVYASTSSSIESISFTAPCGVTAVEYPEDALGTRDDGASVEVTVVSSGSPDDMTVIEPANEQYTFQLEAGMMIMLTASVTAEDGETTEDFTLTVETPTVAACS